jgi:hypothetical protein
MQLSMLLQGTLRGMGCEGACELMARRISTSQPGRFRYTDVVIIRAPSGFPDGDYTLLFDGAVAPVRHHGILWTAGTPTSSDASAIYAETLEEFAAEILREVMRVHAPQGYLPPPTRRTH